MPGAGHDHVVDSVSISLIGSPLIRALAIAEARSSVGAPARGGQRREVVEEVQQHRQHVVDPPPRCISSSLPPNISWVSLSIRGSPTRQAQQREDHVQR